VVIPSEDMTMALNMEEDSRLPPTLRQMLSTWPVMICERREAAAVSRCLRAFLESRMRARCHRLLNSDGLQANEPMPEAIMTRRE
jgi:hypothetical protein